MKAGPAMILLLCVMLPVSGEPYFKESHDRKVMIPGCKCEEPVHVSTKVEEWLYNLGPDRLTRTFHFENGTLTRIETGEYGM